MDALVVPGFSRIGYKLRSRGWQSVQDDMSGRTVVITGATSGLGEAAAVGLARLGARLIVVGRNPAKAEAVLSRLQEESRGQELRSEIVDLSLISQTRDLGMRLLAEEPVIHVLINNAGTLFPERGVTPEGIEQTLATNLLSHFLLTNLLIPRLVESAPTRIINVSSGGMYGQRLSISNLQNDEGEYKGPAAYARTKRAQVILTEMWAEQLAGHGVTVSSMHPGWADTPGVSQSLPSFYKLTKPILRSAEEGADTILWLAASAEATATGKFWHDRRTWPIHKTRRTREPPEARKQLWDSLNALLG